MNANSYIKCYKDPKGYYLDKNDNSYKKCHLTCEACLQNGNFSNHNCISCGTNYTYELNLLNSLNCYNICPFYSYHDSNVNKNFCTPDFFCPISHNKLIKEKKLCVEDCSKDSIYKYQFRHICYQECPLNISEKSIEKDFYCEARCSKELPFEILETQYCVNNCTISERQKGLCKINYESNDEEEGKEAEEKAVYNVKEELTNNFNTSDVDKGDNVVIQQKDSTITISTTENQKSDKSYNISTIDLGECEDKIKEKYDIPKNKSLYILKIDVKQKGLKIPKIEYEVYYPLFGESLIKLNLTVCENSKIDLSIPVVLNDNIDKINSSSNYYNDICYTYTSEDGTDISLADRKKEFVENNLTVCEEDCDFVDYDYVIEKAVCSCKVKTNSTTKIGDIVIDKEKLYNSFTNFKNIANINVLKCYKLIFKLEAYKSNYANFILLGVIFLFLITFFAFVFKEFYDLIKILNFIVFFKLNPNLVKKFLEKQKEENKVIKTKKKKKKINKKDIDINKYDQKNKDGNNEIPLTTEIDGKIIKRPIFYDFWKVFEENKWKGKKVNNPIKKKKKAIKTIFDYRNNNDDINTRNILNVKYKIKKNTLDNNNNIINKLPTKNEFPKINYNKDELIKDLSESEIYEMFLKLNRNTPIELNNLTYKKAIKKDKRSFCQYYI